MCSCLMLEVHWYNNSDPEDNSDMPLEVVDSVFIHLKFWNVYLETDHIN